jgi:hypothetical protein
LKMLLDHSGIAGSIEYARYVPGVVGAEVTLRVHQGSDILAAVGIIRREEVMQQ